MTSPNQKCAVQVRAKIQSVRHFQNNFAILKCVQGKNVFSALGTVTLQGDLAGVVVTLTGSWDVNPKWGRQFKFDNIKMEGSELWFFLAKIVRGIGENLAHSLIEHYGEDELLRILSDEPQKLTEFKGIKKKKLEKICASWEKYRPLQELSQYLAPFGVSTNLIIRAYNHFDNKALSVVKSNPYTLTQVRGIGFKTADDVAMKIGVEPDSPFRVDSCIEYVLQKLAEDTGDTVIEPCKLAETVTVELTSEGEPDKALVSIIDARIDHLEKNSGLINTDGLLSLPSYHYLEKRILEIIDRRLALPTKPLMSKDRVEVYIRKMESELGFSFSEEQSEAIRLAGGGHRTFIISGVAGAGKTTIAKAVLSLLAQSYGEDSICCMALSGIAADRVRKTSGFESATIHTTLGWKGDQFEYGEENPLPHKVVLLDESSMVNSALFRRVLEAVSDEATLVLLGDPAQLPPIGSGDVFLNLVESGHVPAVKLTKIYRQSEDSVLVAFANEVRQGTVPEGYLEKGYRDFEFVDRSLPRNYYQLPTAEKEPLRDENTAEIIEIIRKKTLAAKSLIRNPITDFQVLSPIRRGPLGTEALNLLLQGLLNPSDYSGQVLDARGVTFKPHDKVVHTVNKDMSVTSYTSYKERGFVDGNDIKVYNGSLGTVLSINPEEGLMDVFYPPGVVVRYEQLQLGDIIEHAFCLSVHKVQGSEFARVILPITSLHWTMLNAKWLYTALTRAKSKIVVVGQKYMFERACKSLVTTKRKTVLELLLKQSLSDSIDEGRQK